jgi:hypothetical protein
VESGSETHRWKNQRLGLLRPGFLLVFGDAICPVLPGETITGLASTLIIATVIWTQHKFGKHAESVPLA